MRRIPPDSKTAGIPSVAAATIWRTEDADNVTGMVVKAPVAVLTGRYTVVWILGTGVTSCADVVRSTAATAFSSATGTSIVPSTLPNLACDTMTGTEVSNAPTPTDSLTIVESMVGTLMTSSPLAVYIRTSPIVD